VSKKGEKICYAIRVKRNINSKKERNKTDEQRKKYEKIGRGSGIENSS
jgi:hypothetical protein